MVRGGVVTTGNSPWRAVPVRMGRWRALRGWSPGACALAAWIASSECRNIERFDQQENYGGRVVGTILEWSDYAAMARGLRLYAERVEDADRLEGAIADAFERAPALIDLVTTRDAVSSDAGKGLGWVPDRQALTAWDEAEKERRR